MALFSMLDAGVLLNRQGFFLLNNLAILIIA
jgi:hypothetical protein